MKKILYFAYGSNLLMKQVNKRCKMALPLERAILRNYRLVYRKNLRGRAVADIIPYEGGKVYGAIYEFTPEDVLKMDKFEGVPSVYNRKFIDVETREGIKRCLTYTMLPYFEYGIPKKDYFIKIYNGYKDWHLPTEYLIKEFKKFKHDLKNSNLN